MLVFDDFRNLLTGSLSFRTGPEGIDVAHLLLHMQTDISAHSAIALQCLDEKLFT